MDILFKIGQFVLIISILVVLHEFGHYLPAKLFKTKIEKFFLFFDVKFALFSKKIGETTWGIGWLPLGGYVKIAGMIDESMDREQMAKPAEPWEFRSKPAWQRLIIMCGGVIVNFLLAWVIYTCLLINNGDSYIPTQKLANGIEVDTVGEAIGFKTGDRILKVDDREIKKMNQAMMEILLGDEVIVERDGEKVKVVITDENKKMLFSSGQTQFISPRLLAQIGFVKEGSIADELNLEIGDKVISTNGKQTPYWKDWADEIIESRGDTIRMQINRSGNILSKSAFLPLEGRLGVAPEYKELFVTDEYNFLNAIPAGFGKTIEALSGQVRQFKVVFNTKTEAYKEVGGPVKIVQMMPTEWNSSFFWNFLAMFSVWLAFVNILPIPALDGGHVMFLLYEIISGKKPSQRVLEIGQIVGFVLVMGLMLVVFGNDIWNLFKG